MVLWCQSACSSPIGEISVSFSKSVENPTANSVYGGDGEADADAGEFADISGGGYKKDEAFKVGLIVKST